MKKFLFVPATVVALLFAFNAAIALADEKKEGAEPTAGSVKEQMDNLVKQGPGVYNIKKDNKGRVQSLVIVAQSRISTVLGAAKGKEMARKKASQSAEAEFVKWLGDKVEVHESQNNDATLFIQGDEGNDKNALSEAGKAVEKSSDSYKSAADGLVRGLQLLHSDINAEDKEFTLVCGWSLANAKAAKNAATHDPGIKDKRAPAVEPAESKPASTEASGKSIRSQKATSKEAEDFLK